MKDEQLKNIWNMMNDKSGTLGSLDLRTEQFIQSSSGSVQEKIRSLLQNDLILKLISAIAFLLNVFFYLNTLQIIYVCIAGILFWTIMTTIEWKTLQGFNKIADPADPTRDNLSKMLVFLRRKANIYELTIASSQALIFIPGLLIYFFLVYGAVKPMTGESFVVFTILCLIGTIVSFFRTKSQIEFHIKHLTICLSDLNDNSLGFALETIERQRKQDHLIKSLVGLVLILGFLVFIAIYKSIVA
jgi:hypothetical protein